MGAMLVHAFSLVIVPEHMRETSRNLGCRVHNRTSSQALGVLSLNLFKTVEAVPPSRTESPASGDAGAGAGHVAPVAASNTSQEGLSDFGAAVKAAIATLVPACVALPLTVTAVGVFGYD